MFALLVFPVLGLGAGSDRRERQAQRLIHLSFRVFVWFMTVLGLIRVAAKGTQELRGVPPRLVIANHPTLIDVVLLIACMPQADCVVKRASWRNPFLRFVVSGAGYIPNDEGETLVRDCSSRLRAGRWLLLFPEGTRSPRGTLGEFRRGAARIALESGVDIVPVIITCDPPTLMKGQPWYEVPDRTAQFRITVKTPIAVRLEATTAKAVAVRHLTEEFRTLYEQRLRHAYIRESRD